MHTTALKTLLFTLSLGSFAFAQESPPDLARARTTFASADQDQSGDVSLREATASGHSVAEFRGFDLDGDGALTQSEFIVGYRSRMGAGGARVAPDLENEARRILAQRRAEQADAARRRQDAEQAGPGARRSDALREAARTSGVDPARIRNQVQEHKADEPDANADPKRRATDALQELQRRQDAGARPAPENAPAAGANTANAPGPGPNVPSTAADAPAPAANAPVQGPNTTTPGANAPTVGSTPPSPGVNAPGPATAPVRDPANAAPVANAPELGARANVPAAEGPGARRLSPNERVTPEELQRLFRQRRERAASDSADDPRVEAERQRTEEARQAGEARRAGGAAGDTGRAPAPARGAAPPARSAPAPARGTPTRSRGGI